MVLFQRQPLQYSIICSGVAPILRITFNATTAALHDLTKSIMQQRSRRSYHLSGCSYNRLNLSSIVNSPHSFFAFYTFCVIEFAGDRLPGETRSPVTIYFWRRFILFYKTVVSSVVGQNEKEYNVK